MKYNVESITSDNRTEFAGLTEVETKINSIPRNILNDTAALTAFVYFFGAFCLHIN
jgi:IS30 family transposase